MQPSCCGCDLHPVKRIILGRYYWKCRGDAVFAATQAASMPVFLGSLLDEVVVDVPDKLITLIVVFFILKGLPKKLTLYEANSEIETLD